MLNGKTLHGCQFQPLPFTLHSDECYITYALSMHACTCMSAVSRRCIRSRLEKLVPSTVVTLLRTAIFE